MSKNTCRMLGLLTMLVSIFFLIGGLYLKGGDIPSSVATACLAVGLVLLVAGVILYRVLKSDS